MTALEDINNQCEQLRTQLTQTLTRIYELEHANTGCEHPQAECLENEVEASLKLVDTATAQYGTPWHIALTNMVRIANTNLKRLEGDK